MKKEIKFSKSNKIIKVHDYKYGLTEGQIFGGESLDVDGHTMRQARSLYYIEAAQKYGDDEMLAYRTEEFLNREKDKLSSKKMLATTLILSAYTGLAILTASISSFPSIGSFYGLLSATLPVGLTVTLFGKKMNIENELKKIKEIKSEIENFEDNIPKSR